MKRANILFFKSANKCTRLLADIAEVHKRDSENPSRYFNHYRANSTQQKIQDITEAYIKLFLCDETNQEDSDEVRAALIALLRTEAAPHETKVYQLRNVGEDAYSLGAGDEDVFSLDAEHYNKYWNYFDN